MNGLFFAIASLLWSVVNGIRRIVHARLFRTSSRFRPGKRVISVGNLQAGGTGKTPLIIALARQAVAKGLKVAVLMRGYGGALEKCGGVIPPSPLRAGSIEPELFGDEAVLIHQAVPECWVVVGADRKAMVRKVQRKYWDNQPADLILLDDGFQNLSMEKDLELLLVTSHTLWTRVFRDFTLWARLASSVLWTKGEKPPSWLLRSGLPFESLKVVSSLATVEQRARRYRLVCGVGDAEDLRRSAEAAGFVIVDQVIFRDHAQYESDLLRTLLHRSAEERVRLLTTAKDWVKWRGISSEHVDILGVELQLPPQLQKKLDELWCSDSHRQNPG